MPRSSSWKAAARQLSRNALLTPSSPLSIGPRRLLRGWVRSVLDFIAITTAPAEGASRTVLRRLSTIGLSLHRASEAVVVAERAARGELQANAIESEIERIRKLPAPYGRQRWFSPRPARRRFSRKPPRRLRRDVRRVRRRGGGSFFRSLLQARKVGRSVHTFAGALLSALLATAGLRLGLTATAPATLLGSIIYMVPGIALATGFVDLVSDHHMLAGAERILNAAFIFLILALSLVIADALL